MLNNAIYLDRLDLDDYNSNRNHDYDYNHDIKISWGKQHTVAFKESFRIREKCLTLSRATK